MYDHQTESLWSQMMEKSLAGPQAGKKLTKLNSIRTTWKTWRKKYPQTDVLSDQTGYWRDYSQDPYQGYYRVGTIMFPVGKVRTDLSAKTRVLGLELDGVAMAFPLQKLQEKVGIIRDRVGSTEVLITINSEGEVIGVTQATGQPIAHIFAFWFAWQAFHPETLVR